MQTAPGVPVEEQANKRPRRLSFTESPTREYLESAMKRGLTKKHDFEKGRAKSSTQKPDYQERFQDEGDNFDRGGKKRMLEQLVQFRGGSMYINMRPGFDDDRSSLIRTLSGWKFQFGGKVGTIDQLKKHPEIRDEVDQRFGVMCRSILRAEDIVGVVTRPGKSRELYLLEFRCGLRPVEPLPNPIFKRYLAFKPVYKGDQFED